MTGHQVEFPSEHSSYTHNLEIVRNIDPYTLGDENMRTRKSVALFLGLGAFAALLLGCGQAPASQVADPPPQVKVAEPPSVAQVEEPPKPVQETPPDTSATNGSEAEVVEVGYQVGLRAPEFEMSLLDGSTVTTSSIVDEGKPVLLYFHATY